VITIAFVEGYFPGPVEDPTEAGADDALPGVVVMVVNVSLGALGAIGATGPVGA